MQQLCKFSGPLAPTIIARFFAQQPLTTVYVIICLIDKKPLSRKQEQRGRINLIANLEHVGSSIILSRCQMHLTVTATFLDESRRYPLFPNRHDTISPSGVNLPRLDSFLNSPPVFLLRASLLSFQTDVSCKNFLPLMVIYRCYVPNVCFG